MSNLQSANLQYYLRVLETIDYMKLADPFSVPAKERPEKIKDILNDPMFE